LWIVGFPGAVVDGIEFVDCIFKGVETAEVVTSSADVRFRNTRIEPAQKARSSNSPEVKPEKK
jgi:hypothetical protein